MLVTTNVFLGTVNCVKRSAIVSQARVHWRDTTQKHQSWVFGTLRRHAFQRYDGKVLRKVEIVFGIYFAR